MAIPIHTTGSVGAITNLSAPLLQFARDELKRKEMEVAAGNQDIAARRDPAHIGMGVEVKFKSNHVNGDEGYASDFNIRADLLNLAIDPLSGQQPEKPTPAIHVSTNLKYYDENGEQNWLVGGPLESTRLRSVDSMLSWDINGWDAEIKLEDAVWNGNVDWGSKNPCQMKMSSLASNVDSGFGELMAVMLDENNSSFKVEGSESELFIHTLELLNIVAPSNGNNPYSLLESNIQALCNSPDSYLNQILCDNNGNWNLARSSHTGSTILELVKSRIPQSRLISDSENSRFGQLEINIPLKSLYEGCNLYIHPSGSIEFILRQYPIGSARLSSNLLIDLTETNNTTSDNITMVMDTRLDLNNDAKGIFSGAYLHYVNDETNQNLPITLDLHLPRFGKIISPLQDLQNSSQNSSTWFATSDSIRLFPAPTVGGQSIGQFLSSTSPMMLLDMMSRLTIDAFLLSRLKEEGLLGEILEVFDLVTQQKDGRYRCNSLLNIIRNPSGYLQSQFIIDGGFNVAKLIELSSAVMRFIGLDFEEILDNNNEIIGIKFVIRNGLGLPSAELKFILYHDSMQQVNANGFSIILQNLAQQSSIDLQFNLQANLLPGPIFNIDGTSISISAYPQLILTGSGASEIFPSGSLIGLSSSFSQGVLSLGLDVNIDGINTAHLDILPNLNGTQNFFATLLQSTTGSVLPNLLTLLLKELRGVTFGNQNQHDLGLLLIGFFHDIDLWGPAADETGSFIPNKVAAIASDPGRWLTGPGTTGSDGWPFNEAQLENVIIGGIRVGCVIMSSKLTYLDHTNGGDDYIEITLQATSPTLSLEIGKKANGDFGIWLVGGEVLNYGVHPDDAAVSLGLDIGVSAACLFNLLGGFSIEPEVALSVRSTAPFATASTLRVMPGIGASWNLNDGFVIEATTDILPSNQLTTRDQTGASGSSMGFWIRYESNGNQHWKGMPDLGDLIAGALDVALGFVEGVQSVQEWLGTPLLYPTTVTSNPQANLPDWYDSSNSTVHNEVIEALQQVSTPGEIAVALGLMIKNPSSYAFEDVLDVFSDWKADPLGMILNGVFSLIESGIGDDGELPIYQKTEGSFRFTIKLVDSNPATGQSTFGIAIEFEEPPEIELGNLRLQLFTDDPYSWVNAKNSGTAKNYHTGVAFYFANWDQNATTPVTPNLSIELGGLGFRLYRDDGKPLLEKFLLLNQLEMAFCVDVDIHPTSSIEFGGLLVLDDFGIELGGGDSDGGNGMAKGLLSGGDDGKDAVKPIFDIAISKYNGYDMDLSIRGGTEFWFPINKQFGPVNVAEVGVKYSEDTSGDFQNPHRLSILLDASAEISGFYAACDDLGVNIPILRPFDFDDWGFELKAMAIKMDKGKLKIAGALAKQDEHAYFVNPVHQNITNPVLDLSSHSNAKAWVNGQEVDADWALPYVEYQGLCSIITPTFGISAVGAFARVPKEDGTGFVSCFIIAALDMPLGGPPFFFVNGLLGGLGLNRDLILPSIDEVNEHLLIESLGGFSDPMAALANIKPQFPVKYGSFWFALGLKFKTVEIIETRAVLFARFGDDFTIGLLGLSTMDLPKPSMRIAHIELAIMAYYDSGENLLWVQAQLTDDSYLFDESCRLTGGFALVTWFNTGEFVISLGGYHPNFNVPDYYPVVPRLGFNWKPTNTLTVKGGVYFTLCSRAVMLGGRLDASFKKGKIKASFVAGMDALVEFDPFFYELDLYINLSVRVGRLKAGIGADLHIEGPKMRGVAQLEVLFVKFKVKFGSNSSKPPQLSLKEFVHKHIRQLPSDQTMKQVSSWLNSDDAHTTTMVEGIIRSKEQDEADMGKMINPYLVGPEFSLSIASKFPSSTSIFMGQSRTRGKNPKGDIIPSDSMVLFPVGEDSISPLTKIRLYDVDNQNTEITNLPGLDYIPSMGGFAPSTWSKDGKNSNKAAQFFMNGGLMKATSSFEDGGQCIAFEGNIEPCEMDMHLPLEEDDSALNSMVGGLSGVTVDTTKIGVGLIESLLTDTTVTTNAKMFKEEVEKNGSFRNTDQMNIELGTSGVKG